MLSDEITKNIKTGQQTILFLNRRGYASFVLCRSCGYTVRCPHCNITLTYHSFDERLICHYCGHTTKMPKLCPKCSSSYIRHFGTGTQKVEEDILKHFPGSSVIRMDMDTTTGKNSHEEILRAFREQNINILVGTQMIAKGHDFPNVTLVGVLAADSLLNLDDYKASERTFQLITQVAGRAGRGELPGRVIIQTYNTEDFSIVAACGHDYASFYVQEIKIREKLQYPPFINIAVAILSSVNDRLAFTKAKEVMGLLMARLDSSRNGELVLGPMRAPLSKIKNRYRWRIVIKCASMEKLINVLSEISDEFQKTKGKNEIELGVDINPVNML
jgi:primosomal protein N' (replication factor Y) (superfamily II helicase)